MTILRKLVRLLPVLALLFAIAPAPPSIALAQDSLAAAKSAGLVGERPDGLVGYVQDQVPAEVRALVEQVNNERRARYSQVAQSTGQPLATVQAVAGDRLIAATPAGQFVMNAAGRWTKK